MRWKRLQIKSGGVNESEKSMQLVLSAVCPSKRKVKHNNHVELLINRKLLEAVRKSKQAREKSILYLLSLFLAHFLSTHWSDMQEIIEDLTKKRETSTKSFIYSG